MDIQRVNGYDDPRFRREVLAQHGAFLADGQPWEVLVSLDGHTRLYAALERGFCRVLGFETQPGDYMSGFVEEARRRGVRRVRDMKKLPHRDYSIQWDSFCDDFFARRAQEQRDRP